MQKNFSEFGKGFEIRCPNLDPNPEERPPIIYSPIEGKRLGRIRLRNPAVDPTDCRNDGVFIIGKGAWEGTKTDYINTGRCY